MSDVPLYLLEPDRPGAEWAPFAGVRPLSELRAGLWKVRERWEGILGTEAKAILGAHCAGFYEGAEPPVEAPRALEGPCVVARSTFAPSGESVEFEPGVRRFVHEGETIGWVVAAGERWEGPHEEGDGQEVPGLPLHGAYDLLTALEHLLPGDCAELSAGEREPLPDGTLVIGDPGDVVLLGAAVEPGVVFDTRAGVVVVDEAAQVRHGARLEGPLYVGPATLVLGGEVRGSVLGPHCRVRGEVSSSVFLGYANKAHDGFLGHSVLGHWVNLGAGTTTSNLKNTYGEVSLDAAGTRIDTGRQFLGSLIGDHAKTAIGTMLGTGTVVGAGANVFGGAVPKWVPPFAWGVGGRERVTEEGFLRTAGRVLPRRHVELTPERAASLTALHRRLAGA